jgi:Putative zinc-finger
MLRKGISKLACRWRFAQLMSAHVDHELDGKTSKSMDDHLQECEGCRTEYENLRFARKAMMQFEIPAPRGSWDRGRVLASTATESTSLFKNLFSHKVSLPLPIAAGLLLVVFIAFLFMLRGRQAERSQTTPSQPQPAVVKIVEMPVERTVEKIITRTVFVRRTAPKTVTPPENLNAPDANADLARVKSNSSQWWNRNLESFRPASSANLRVVKEQE